MPTLSQVKLLLVGLVLSTLTAGCDFVGPLDLCVDWTDTGQPCDGRNGGNGQSFYYKAILFGAADKAGAAFDPDSFTTTVGASRSASPPVTWLNYDSVAHHLVSDAALFDTGLVAANTSINVKFTKAGTFEYHCIIHPAMVGTIIVKP